MTVFLSASTTFRSAVYKDGVVVVLAAVVVAVIWAKNSCTSVLTEIRTTSKKQNLSYDNRHSVTLVVVAVVVIVFVVV